MIKPFRLITNISAVSVATTMVTTIECYAILFEVNDKDSLLGLYGQYKIRGFLSEGSLPTFTIRPEENPMDVPFIGMESTAKFMTDSGIKPLSTGATLRFPKFELNIYKAMQEKDFDIQEFDNITTVWDELQFKTAQYWQHPAMPVAHFVRAEIVRAALER